MSQSETQKNLLFRPWEEKQESTRVYVARMSPSSSGQRCTIISDTQVSTQIHPSVESVPQQPEIITTKHVRLIQEFKKAPRNSLSGSLWINTLLHSYIARINTAVTEADKIQIITQTRQLLRTYLQMSMIETKVKADERKQNVVKNTNGKMKAKDQITSTGLNAKDNGSRQFMRTDYNTLTGTPKYQMQTSTDVITEVKRSPLTPSGSSRLLPPTTPDSGYKSAVELTPNIMESNSAIFVSPDFRGSHLKSNVIQNHPFLTSPLSTQQIPSIPSRTALEEWYLENKDCPYATDSIAEDLATHSGLSKGQVLKWLSNRRNKDGNTKKSAGRRRKNELNRAKPYAPKRLPQLHLEF